MAVEFYSSDLVSCSNPVGGHVLSTVGISNVVAWGSHGTHNVFALKDGLKKWYIFAKVFRLYK